jgi:hypothetical protein
VKASFKQVLVWCAKATAQPVLLEPFNLAWVLLIAPGVNQEHFRLAWAQSIVQHAKLESIKLEAVWQAIKHVHYAQQENIKQRKEYLQNLIAISAFQENIRQAKVCKGKATACSASLVSIRLGRGWLTARCVCLESI